MKRNWLSIGLLALGLACCLPVLAQTPEQSRFEQMKPAPPLSPAKRFLLQRGILPTSNKAGVHRQPRPAAQMMKARREHSLLPVLRPAGASPLGANLSAAWQPAGPAQVLTAAYGKVTGRVTSIAIDPADATGNTVYVGTIGGGVWKSTNAAGAAASVIFVPLTDVLTTIANGDQSSISIGAVTVQPGATGIILAGTGDPNDAFDSYYGTGLLRSADNGLTWSLISQSSDAQHGPSQNF